MEKSFIIHLDNYERHKDTLEKGPYKRKMDLAISCSRLLWLSSTEMSTEKVTWEMLEQWNLSPEHLFEMAESNSRKQLPPVIEPMSEVLKGFFMDEFMEGLRMNPEEAFEKAKDEYIHLFGHNVQDMPEIYVLSNTLKIRGAASIFYSNILKDFSDHMGTDLILLPSSIHEWLIIPQRDEYQLDMLTKMVEEANRDVVAENEILSDRVYGYFRDKNIVSILGKKESNPCKPLDKTKESC